MEPPALDAGKQRVRAAGVLLDRQAKPQEWAKHHLADGLNQPSLFDLSLTWSSSLRYQASGSTSRCNDSPAGVCCEQMALAIQSICLMPASLMRRSQ